MNELSMDRLMLDLQRLASQAQSKTNETSSIGVSSSSQPEGFSDLLKKAVGEVNNAQQTAEKLKKAFEVGDPGVDLPDVMVATQKASLAFDAMLEVRKHLLKAYQDIMNMPV